MLRHTASPRKKAEVAVAALTRGGRPLLSVAREHEVYLWEAQQWAIELRQKGFLVFDPETKSDEDSQHRLVFVHLEKTAGTALTTHLEDLFHVDKICSVRWQSDLEKLALEKNLSDFHLFCGHFHYGWFRRFTTFGKTAKYLTVLRHPLDRQISSFKHFMRETVEPLGYVSPLVSEANIQCLKISPLSMREGFASLKDHLEAAKESLEDFWFVGIQERFAESMGLLFRKLGLPENMHVRQRNISDNRIDEPLPGQLVDEILEMNWADIELYNFAVDLFENRLKTELSDACPLFCANEFGTPSRTINYSVRDPLVGVGWHEREGLVNHDVPWRWSGPDNRSELNVCIDPSGRCDFELSVGVINAMAPDILESLDITVNDNPIEIRQVRDQNNQLRFSGLLPLAYLGGSTIAKIVFRVARTLKHSEVNAAVNDDRSCGIAITDLSIKPL